MIKKIESERMNVLFGHFIVNVIGISTLLEPLNRASLIEAGKAAIDIINTGTYNPPSNELLRDLAFKLPRAPSLYDVNDPKVIAAAKNVLMEVVYGKLIYNPNHDQILNRNQDTLKIQHLKFLCLLCDDLANSSSNKTQEPTYKQRVDRLINGGTFTSAVFFQQLKPLVFDVIALIAKKDQEYLKIEQTPVTNLFPAGFLKAKPKQVVTSNTTETSAVEQLQALNLNK